eukprot:922703-Alexandrium_andersonii.AAC.1
MHYERQRLCAKCAASGTRHCCLGAQRFGHSDLHEGQSSVLGSSWPFRALANRSSECTALLAHDKFRESLLGC